MPCCCLLVVALLIPRVTLFFMWVLNYTGTAFETRVWPLLGFLFMPYTTVCYAIGMNESGGFHGWSLVLLALGIVLDVSGHLGTANRGQHTGQRI